MANSTAMSCVARKRYRCVISRGFASFYQENGVIISSQEAYADLQLAQFPAAAEVKRTPISLLKHSAKNVEYLDAYLKIKSN